MSSSSQNVKMLVATERYFLITKPSCLLSSQGNVNHVTSIILQRSVHCVVKGKENKKVKVGFHKQRSRSRNGAYDVVKIKQRSRKHNRKLCLRLRCLIFTIP